MSSFSPTSSWDRKKFPKRLSPAFVFSPGRVVYEFDNRGRSRIFSATAGAVTLRETNLTESRDRVITENIESGRYHSISHTHIPTTLLDPQHTILAHGAKRSDGFENCAVMGAECTDGVSDSQCVRGKCAIGRLSKVSNRDLWRYDSLTVDGLYYYLKGDVSVQLKHISRGKFKLPAGSGEIDVNTLASISTIVYLPASSYSNESFVRRVIKYFDGENKVRSLQDSCDNFVRSVIQTDINAAPLSEEVVNRVKLALESEIPSDLYVLIAGAIDQYVIDNTEISNREFLVEVYGLISSYFTRCVQKTTSSIRPSRLNYSSDIARPIYNRLPGVSGRYNDEDNPENPSKWLVSGADEALSHSKILIDRFYDMYLDPDTAYPLCLDWIAQHMGFMGGMWDLEWDSSVKRLLLKNAHVNRIEETVGGLWTFDPDEDTLGSIDRSRIETVEVDGGEVQTVSQHFRQQYDEETGLTTVVPVNTVKVSVNEWPGLIPSRGGMTSLVFLFHVFGVKSVSGEELRYNTQDGTFSVKSGLRRSQQTSTVNVPYGTDMLHVGTEGDQAIGNYPNQLIADVGVCYDEEMANTVVIRMPFYYNRNGRTWDSVVTIAENWLPATANTKVQYGYAVAGLLTADDVFFEPEVV